MFAIPQGNYDDPAFQTWLDQLVQASGAAQLAQQGLAAHAHGAPPAAHLHHAQTQVTTALTALADYDTDSD